MDDPAVGMSEPTARGMLKPAGGMREPAGGMRLQIRQSQLCVRKSHRIRRVAVYLIDQLTFVENTRDHAACASNAIGVAARRIRSEHQCVAAHAYA